MPSGRAEDRHLPRLEPRRRQTRRPAADRRRRRAARLGGQAARPALAPRRQRRTRAIGAPDDALMRALLDRLFARRGLDARAGPDRLAARARIERSHIAVLRAVDALDQEALERRKRLSIPLARTTLADAGILPTPRQAEDDMTRPAHIARLDQDDDALRRRATDGDRYFNRELSLAGVQPARAGGGVQPRASAARTAALPVDLGHQPRRILHGPRRRAEGPAAAGRRAPLGRRADRRRSSSPRSSPRPTR